MSVLCTATIAVGQHSSMPTDGSLPPPLVSHFDGTHADVMDLAPSGSVHASLVATFENDPAPYVVRLRWAASQDIQGQQVTAPTVEVVETVSFMPTALCRASANNNVIFVAGWTGRVKACVVEKWTFGLGTFATTLHPNGTYTGVFTPPVVDREVIYLSGSGIAAVEGMAQHPVSDTLILLEEGPEANLHLLDMQGTLTEIADATTLPALAGMADIRLGSHTNMPYAAFLVNERAWSADYASTFLVVPDSDGDGAYEVTNSFSLDHAGLVLAFPPTGWLVTN